MPEGPEVQAIVNQLQEYILDKEITDFFVVSGAEHITHPLPPQEFRERIIGKRVLGVARKGKYIDIELSTGLHILFHLLINGRLRFIKSLSESAKPRYVRCNIVFHDNSVLYFSDSSKWLRVGLFSHESLASHKSVQSLGVDIYSDEFSLDGFQKVLKSSKSIHARLLDQTKISGLGNIYVTEALFWAGIHPLRRANSLSSQEALSLYFAIKNIVTQALNLNGTTLVEMINKRRHLEGYYTPDGNYGGFQSHICVFQRAGKPCPRCGSAIEHVKIAGRSATYCPSDQALSESPPNTSSSEKTIYEDKKPVQRTFDFFEEKTGKQLPTKIFVIYGLPSVGKSTLTRLLLENIPFLSVIPTLKTRQPRGNVYDERESRFLPEGRFLEIENRGEFAVCTKIYDVRYGILRKDIQDMLHSGNDGLAIAWADGAKALKEEFPSDVCVIGMTNDDMAELRNRIIARPDYTDSKRQNSLHAIQHEPVPTDICDLVIKGVTPSDALVQTANLIYSVRSRIAVNLYGVTE